MWPNDRGRPEGKARLGKHMRHKKKDSAPRNLTTENKEKNLGQEEKGEQ